MKTRAESTTEGAAAGAVERGAEPQAVTKGGAITRAFAEGIREAIPAEGEREEAGQLEESEGDESGRG